MSHDKTSQVIHNGSTGNHAETKSRQATRARRVLITGGAGFVGINLAKEFLQQGQQVILFDSLARAGVEENLEWICGEYPEDVEVVLGDVRDFRAVQQAVSLASQVYHFAAQVAVTTSLDDPRQDFAVNAQGMLNVLESVRRQAEPPSLLFTSTNKVYGDLRQLQLEQNATRWQPKERLTRDGGITETQPLDFHSPYGCSKGSADQYVLDYARCYRLPAVVFRMSCIYGPHQFGTEDQGWLAHFLLRAMRREPITIYGDGKQVRDVLFVQDLVEALTMALDRIRVTRGRAFNIGGGPHRSVSLLDLIALIEKLLDRPIETRFETWRKGDQKYYVSNSQAFQRATEWRSRTSVESGVKQLLKWLAEHRAVESTISRIHSQAPLAAARSLAEIK